MPRLSVVLASAVVAAVFCTVAVVSYARNNGVVGSPQGPKPRHAKFTQAPIPEVKLAMPPGFATNSELLAEYNRLAGDLHQLKSKLRKMHARLRDEAQPPDTKGMPPMRGNLFGAAPDQAALVLPPAKESVDTDTIFVSIASFRDDECFSTVKNMYAQAKNPRRVFLGIIEQNDPTDKNLECLPDSFASSCDPSSFCPADNIRIRRVTAQEAKGPTFGRYVAMLMYRDEKYFMMIDSHNRFVSHWDSRVISMYRQIPSKRGVLSHYPASWSGEGMQLEGHPHVTVMCNAHFIGTGFLRMDGMVMERSAIPRLQPFSAAGFLFADAKLVQEVPFDPNLDYLFDGEEILFSARMWTHGWDMYAPTENILFHYYIRSHAPRVWSVPNNQWWVHQRVSNARVQMFLKVNVENSTELMWTPDKVRATAEFKPEEKQRLLADLDKYGLGDDRSLDDYWKFAMVDPVKRQGGGGYCNTARQLGRG